MWSFMHCMLWYGKFCVWRCVGPVALAMIIYTENPLPHGYCLTIFCLKLKSKKYIFFRIFDGYWRYFFALPLLLKGQHKDHHNMEICIIGKPLENSHKIKSQFTQQL